MNKFQDGKIYKIVDVGYNKCYVGSTCESLSQRMARHRYMYNQYTTRGKESYRSCNLLFDEFGVENCKIELIEEYPCNNQMELHRREGHYIQCNDCLNKNVAGRTDKEYREQNKERHRENNKEYYYANKDKRQAYCYANRERIAELQKQYREKNKEHIKAQKKEYREQNIDKIKETYKKWYEENKAERNMKSREYHKQNKERDAETMKAYFDRNKERIMAKREAKYTCICGATLRSDGRYEHERTRKHQEYIKQQEEK